MDQSFNIAVEFLRQAREQPQRAALVVENKTGATPAFQLYSYAQLLGRCGQLTAQLQSIGIKRGMRVALMVPVGLDFYAVALSIIGIGAAPVVIDPGLGLNRVKRCLAIAKPEAFVGSPLAHWLRRLLGWGRATVRMTLTVRGPGAILPEGNAPFVAMAGAEPAAIIFTSGSTGPSKGVMLTHGMIRGQFEAIKAALRLEPGDRDFGSYPLLALFAPGLGMTSIMPRLDVTRVDRADAARMLAAITAQRATTMFASPALVRRLGLYGSKHGVRLPTLRVVVMAGAPAEAGVIEKFLPMLEPHAELMVLYGATEALPVCMMDGRRIVAETDRATAQGKGVCLGRPLPSVEVRIIIVSDAAIGEWSDALEVEPGEIGEITVRGEMVAGGYMADPEATRLARIETASGKHFHRTGDLGWIDAEGQVWFCGRKSQRVIAGGRVFNTIACERIFSAHSAVRRAALVGVKVQGETEPVICIELETESQASNSRKIEHELLKLGAAQPVTAPIRRILFHPSFPVDRRHNSKIGREALAKWAARKIKSV